MEPSTNLCTSLPSIQTPAFVRKALTKIALDHGLIAHTVNIQTVATGANGFMAEIRRAIITDTETQATLTLIVKLMPTNPLRLQMSSALFKREVEFYLNVWPEFEQFQRHKGLNASTGFVSLPKCYFAHYDGERMQSVIILQDMCERHFIVESARVPATYDQARLVMKHLGRLHAISFALADQRPDVYQRLTTVLTENISTVFGSEVIHAMFTINVAKGLQLLGDHEQHIADTIRQYTNNVQAELARLNDGQRSAPFAVLIHGDCWTNNLLFKYKVSV